MALKTVVGVLLTTVVTTSCLFVKAPEQQNVVVVHQAESPLPLLPMSDEMVRSISGDMIAFLPQGWFLLDVESKSAESTIAVAVDPDYTLSAVFTVIPPSAIVKKAVEKEGLDGLAREAFAAHQQRATSPLVQVGSFRTDTVGTRKFGSFSFTGTAGAASRCAVYVSSLGNFYQFALVPLTFSGRELPSDREQDQAFRSILATIQY